ncbi:MAG: hypothetical protein AB7O96_09535 [Pseudobdellovibrionaceae bacterium]
MSACFSGLILPLFVSELGLTTSVLYLMAGVALLCAMYSFACHRFISDSRPKLLLIIAIANLMYCVFTGYIAYDFQGITKVGTALLLAEIFVILGVVALELNVYRKVSRS